MSEQIARQFHEVYERLAPQFGYETREDTKVFDPQSQNGRLMIAVCAEVIGKIKRERDEARSERNQLKSLNESYAACWDEIKNVLNESNQGDKTCDLDRVLKAIRERDDAREALRDMLSGWKYIRSVHGDLYGVGWDRAQSKAETALEGTK